MPKYDRIEHWWSHPDSEEYRVVKGYGRKTVFPIEIVVGLRHIEVAYLHQFGSFGVRDILSCMGRPDWASSHDRFLRYRLHRDDHPPHGEMVRLHCDNVNRVWYITPSLLERLQANDTQMAKMLFDLLIDRVNVVDLLGD